MKKVTVKSKSGENGQIQQKNGKEVRTKQKKKSGKKQKEMS